MLCGTPSYAYTNSVPDQQSLYPDGQHTLAFYIKCVPPAGLHAVVRVGGVSVVTLEGGVICHQNFEDKLVVSISLWQEESFACRIVSSMARR